MTEAVQRLQTDKPTFARQAASNAVLIVALGLFLLADVAMVCGVGSINDEMGGVYLGVLFSQSALAAVWIAWGPISFLGRTAIGMTVVLALVLMLGVSLILSGVPWDILWISLLPLLTCIANWVPLFYVRLRVGIHLGWNSQCSQLEADKHQFGIKQLLLATTIIGAMLGIGRATLTFLGEDTASVGGGAGRTLVFCTVLFVFSVVASWVVISAILGTRRVALWLLPVVSFCAAVTGLELLVYQRMVGANLEVIAWFFASLQGIQFLGIAAPLLALRLRGIRLPIG